MKKSFLAWILALLMMLTLNAALAEGYEKKPYRTHDVSQYIPRGGYLEYKYTCASGTELTTNVDITFTVYPDADKTVSAIGLYILPDWSTTYQCCYEASSNTFTYKFYEPGTYRIFVDYSDESYNETDEITIDGTDFVSQEVNRIASNCPSGDDYTRALWLHDQLATTSYYDSTYTYHSAADLLINHYGVCQSFSEAYRKLAKKIGLNCEIVHSDEECHEWNVIKLDGDWYMMDVTFDTLGEADYGTEGAVVDYCIHTYFALPECVFKVTHFDYTDSWGCTSIADSYFVREGFDKEIVDLLEDDISSGIAQEGNFTLDVSNVYNNSKGIMFGENKVDKGNGKYSYTPILTGMAAEMAARALNGTSRTNGSNVVMNLTATHQACEYGSFDSDGNVAYGEMYPTVQVTATAASHATSGGCGATLNWSYANNILTISGTGAMINYTAENPAPWIANYGTQITKAVIESGATSIGTAAFSGCSALADVAIPASVTAIGDDAFSGCSALAKASVFCASAGYAFASEKNLAITFNHQNLEEFAAASPSCTEEGNIACWYCDACGKFYSDASWETEIAEDSAMIPALGHSIEHQAYKAPTLTEVGNIEYWYCSRCDIRFMDEACTTEVYDEETVLPALCVGQGYCGDPAVNGGKDLTWVLDGEGTLFISGTGAMIDYTAEKPAPWIANYGAQITKVVIESGAASIGAAAFSGCSSLTEIRIPSTVTSFGRGAFEGCSGIQTISVPSGVKVLPEYVFYSCSSLKSISIPATVTRIAKEAFNLCGSLRNVVFAGTEAQWKKISISTGNDPLKNASIAKAGGLKLSLPNKLTSISAGAFAGINAGIIVIPNTCESIGESAFADCPNLVTVYLPKKLKDYEDCFSNKNGLQIQFIYQ